MNLLRFPISGTRGERKQINSIKKGINLRLARNNEELYSGKDTDAVIISTADFQHALLCAEAVKAGQDVYCEKPFAETMADARAARKAVEETGKIVQIGSQRRRLPTILLQMSISIQENSAK